MIKQFRLNLDFNNVRNAADIEKELIRIIKTSLVHEMDQILKDFDIPKDVTILIPEIIIDIGNISSGNAASDFKNRFLYKFKESVSDFIEYETNTNIRERSQKIPATGEIIRFYLKNGYFQWWVESGKPNLFTNLVNGLIKTDFNKLTELLAVKNTNYLRFVQQLDTETRKLFFNKLFEREFEKTKQRILKHEKIFAKQRTSFFEKPEIISKYLFLLSLYKDIYFPFGLKNRQTNTFFTGFSQLSFSDKESNVRFIDSKLKPFMFKFLNSVLRANNTKSLVSFLENTFNADKIYNKTAFIKSLPENIKSTQEFNELFELVTVKNNLHKTVSSPSFGKFKLDLFEPEYLFEIIKYFFFFQEYPAWAVKLINRIIKEYRLQNTDEVLITIIQHLNTCAGFDLKSLLSTQVFKNNILVTHFLFHFGQNIHQLAASVLFGDKAFYLSPVLDYLTNRFILKFSVTEAEAREMAYGLIIVNYSGIVAEINRTAKVPEPVLDLLIDELVIKNTNSTGDFETMLEAVLQNNYRFAGFPVSISQLIAGLENVSEDFFRNSLAGQKQRDIFIFLLPAKLSAAILKHLFKNKYEIITALWREIVFVSGKLKIKKANTIDFHKVYLLASLKIFLSNTQDLTAQLKIFTETLFAQTDLDKNILFEKFINTGIRLPQAQIPLLFSVLGTKSENTLQNQFIKNTTRVLNTETINETDWVNENIFTSQLNTDDIKQKKSVFKNKFIKYLSQIITKTFTKRKNETPDNTVLNEQTDKTESDFTDNTELLKNLHTETEEETDDKIKEPELPDNIQPNKTELNNEETRLNETELINPDKPEDKEILQKKSIEKQKEDNYGAKNKTETKKTAEPVVRAFIARVLKYLRKPGFIFRLLKFLKIKKPGDTQKTIKPDTKYLDVSAMDDLIKNVSKQNLTDLKQFFDADTDTQLFEKIINEKIDWVDNKLDEKKFYVTNAGLVLLCTFLPFLFNRLKMIKREGKKHVFINNDIHERAVHLTQFLVTGKTEHEEHELVLNKIICGFPVVKPVKRKIDITDTERTECEMLLRSAIKHWTILGNTSIAGLRSTFLQRNGVIVYDKQNINLKVEQKAFDVLLAKIPWSFQTIKLSWNEYIIYVEWNA